MPYQCGSWNYFNSFGWGWAPGLCQPWWGGGYGGGGWGYNIGYAPPRYRLPIRPRPRNPRPMGGEVRAVGTQPVIAVNRRLESGNTLLPPRDRTHSVMIGGVVAQPLRPVTERPRYDHVPAVSGNNHVPVFSGNRPTPGGSVSGVNARPGYVRAPAPSGNNRPGSWPAPRQAGPTMVPAPSGGSYARPAAPSRGPSGGAAPSARPMGGGGSSGGGGARPSGGGGNSGGGGARPSGGGGAPAGGGGGGGGARPSSSGPHR